MCVREGGCVCVREGGCMCEGGKEVNLQCAFSCR